ncbi:MAG TPA: hypothetical protein VK622_13890 [Puia sp.]|nr:hypothetical protein [Puia sp.]
MKPLFVLLISFGLAIFAMKLLAHHIDFARAARIAMSAMLLFTAIGHFAFPRGMMMILLPFIPFRLALVYITGIIEIMAAIGLQIASLKNPTAILLIIFFILVLPANIYAAAKHIDYQTGKEDGKGLNYLWFRIPLQILFIIWTWMSTQ